MDGTPQERAEGESEKQKGAQHARSLSGHAPRPGLRERGVRSVGERTVDELIILKCKDVA